MSDQPQSPQPSGDWQQPTVQYPQSGPVQQPYGPSGGQYGYPPQPPAPVPPQGAYMPGLAPGGGLEVIPSGVTTAFRIMIIAGCLEIVQSIVNIGWSNAVADDYNAAARAQTGFTFTLAEVDSGKAWGIGLGAAAFWFVMAVAIRSGNHGARTFGTVLAFLSPLASVLYIAALNASANDFQQQVGVTATNLPGVAGPAVPQVVIVILGFVVVFLTRRQPASDYFRRRIATRPARDVAPGPIAYPTGQGQQGFPAPNAYGTPGPYYPAPTPAQPPLGQSSYDPPSPNPQSGTMPPSSWDAPAPPQ